MKRVVLDFEIKRDVYSYLAKQDRSDKEKYREQQAIVAAAYELQVVRGHIQFPDLRVEYEDDGGQAARFNELYATWVLTSDRCIYDLVLPETSELWSAASFSAHFIDADYDFLSA